MKGPVKALILAVAVVVLVGGAFWGGTAYQGARSPAGVVTAGNGPMQGGPMSQLTEEEQAELDAMTDEERQAYMAEKFGAAPGGTGGARAGGPTRGGALEGEVLEAADDTITLSVASGSQTVYIDENTVIAYVKDAGELAAGATVMVLADPTADGVTTATLVVVK